MSLPVYAVPGSSFQQVGGDCPEGFIVMQSQRPDDEFAALYTALPDGTWGITEETVLSVNKEREEEWLASEMAVVANQLLMLEDGDPTALPGTERQWRDYRIGLRAWKEGAEYFPDQEHRPQRPV